MSTCPPYQATELTDLLFDCKTFELTVIQTAANGDETAVYADLSCILDGKNPVVDVRAGCEDKSLIFEFEDGRLLVIDMTCLDTYMTWTDNLNGSIKLISASGDSSINVMGSCESIEQIFEVPEVNNIVMCDVDGNAVKAPIRNVIESITLNYTQFIDGNGTLLKGEGTLVNPYQVDLDVCELAEVDYNPLATVAVCDVSDDGSITSTARMPAIRAGTGVSIQNSGRLDVSFCDRPEITHEVDHKNVVCVGGATRVVPSIKAGDNVTITPDGILNVSIPDTSNVLPGVIVMYGGEPAPAGYLICNGAAVSRTTYSNLFNIIGTRFGAGNSSTTFNIPNMVDRVTAGATQGAPVGSRQGKNVHSASDIPTHSHTMTSSGEHSHTVNENGSHRHAMNTSSFDNTSGSDRVVDSQNDNAALVNTGSAGNHKHSLVANGKHIHGVNNSSGSGSTGDNRQATIYVNYIIKT